MPPGSPGLPAFIVSRRTRANLSRPELEQLVAQAQAGDRRALERVTAELGPMVLKLAARFRRLDPEAQADCFQEGLIGVQRAIRQYRPERGEFFPYAWSRARSAITYHLRWSEPLIRPGSEEAKGVFRAHRGEDTSEAGQLLATRLRPASLDRARSRGESDSPQALVGFLAAPGSLAPEQLEAEEERSATRERLRRLLRGLPQRSAMILERRLLWPDTTLEELGRELGLTRERVRQLEDRALAQLATSSAAGARLHLALRKVPRRQPCPGANDPPADFAAA